MSIYRPFQKLVAITILGHAAEVPENNLVLRCFQFLAPDSLPYGSFCWNEECQLCRIRYRSLGEGAERQALSCKLLVAEGMEITELAPELRLHLMPLWER